MAYTKRMDGRKFDEFREVEAKVGVVKRADGSAMFRIGKTIAIAAVHGPRDLYPAFKQDSKKGVLRCSYDMLSFSVTERKRPGTSRRSIEIGAVTTKSLSSAVDLSAFPGTVVDVFVDIVQADAGTRCAGICAASMALADAGIPMKDLVSAVSVGKVGDKLVVDLDKEEEDYPDGATDIPVAFLERAGKLTLLQLDGSVSRKELKDVLEMGKKACTQITEVQKKALKSRYSEEGK
tara:strand:+ start:1490 stop:2194 length:705 start_codon:yes stop_codon:yes gene_type:complete